MPNVHRLADVPLVIEWFANIDKPQTQRAYRNALEDFMKFTGIERPDEFREISRAHIIAWRDDLKYRELSGTTIRHRLAALSSLFEYLCDKSAVTHNPVKGTSDHPWKAIKARRRQSAITKREGYWKPQRMSRSRESATCHSGYFALSRIAS